MFATVNNPDIINVGQIISRSNQHLNYKRLKFYSFIRNFKKNLRIIDINKKYDIYRNGIKRSIYH